jgi:cytochrome c553
MFMTLMGRNLALGATVLVIASGGSGHGNDTTGSDPSTADLHSKEAYCKTCHGLGGQGYRGYYPMPRLAGQQTEYLKRQLQDFAEQRRWNPLMFNVARVLDPSMRSALAEHFSDLKSKPVGDGPPELMEMGRKIYEDGISDAGIAPCSGCHGKDAEGDGTSPRLAGQLYDYVLKRLANWREGGPNQASPGTAAIMEPIARSLNEAQIAAVAAYVSDLE